MYIPILLRTTAVLLVFFSLAWSLAAQTITGTVTNAESGDPLVGANIIQAETDNGTATDEEGHFTLRISGEAPSRIQVSYVGYRPHTEEIASGAGHMDIALVPDPVMSNEVFVRALRVDRASPVAYETVSREEIEKQNLGKDIPYLVSNSPSAVATSDAGAGIGYTGVRIRGVDPGRINVTINGIPLNDAESHGVWWVNLPDLASSIENIQIQRGAGTSTNGAGAFGASMNLQTTAMEQEPFGEVNTAVGSFDTRKANIKLGTGRMENGWQFEGRLSKLDSDGYIDRASSDLQSVYLTGARHGDRSLLRADIINGRQTTYQAWYGISEQQLDEDRTYNPAGTEKPGEPYDDQTDNYRQDHYQLHYSYRFTDRWNANTSLHYTYGRGYYEEYKAGQPLQDYGIEPVTIGNIRVEQSDLIRQLWLDNHFYGLVYSTEYDRNDQWSLTLGGGYNEYKGDHFGEVIWARYAGESEIDERYYQNDAFKSDFNSYLKGRYRLSDRLRAYTDFQIRHITYDFLGKDRQGTGQGEQIVDVEQADRLTFFNPKAGLVYSPGDRHRLFASFSVANKEPTRDEYVESTPENRPNHETLYDWEAGYEASYDRFLFKTNFYYMDYRDQLILTGEINDVGAYIRQNVPRSYRTGIELQAGIRLLPELEWSGNATFSRNKIHEYTQYLDNYDTGEQETLTYKETDVAFSPWFTGNSVISFVKESFSAEFTSKYVSRQYLDNTQNRNRSLDPYFTHNLQIGYELTDLPYLKGLEASLQLNNIFNNLYESNGYSFGYILGEEEIYENYFYPQAGRHLLMQLSFRF